MVAIKGPGAASFSKSPDARFSAFLLFGTDAGLVSERAGQIARALAAREHPHGEIVRLDDADLENDPDRLAVELQTLPMFGGRKVIRASAGRRINAQVLKPLVEGSTLAATLIVEAGNLRADESLRALFEKSPQAAAVGCYLDEGRDLDTLVREVVDAAGIGIAAEARELLLNRLGADRALSRNEVEKLVLYAQGKARIEAEDVDAVVGDASELALDRVIVAAAGGNATLALNEHDRAIAAGESPQLVISSVQRYLQRLHRIRASLDAGRGLDEIIRSLRPPVHFKARPALEAHARAWSTARLDEALSRAARSARDARLGSDLERAHSERLLIEVARLARVSAASASPRRT